MTKGQLKIVFIAFGENSLGRRILNGMIHHKLTPIHAFMASEKAFKAFRKNSIRRFLKNNGVLNTAWRILYRLTLRRDVKNKSLQQEEGLKKSIRELCEAYNIPLGYFDNINHPDFVKVLSLLQPDLIVLGGAPIIKKPVIEIPRIGILNSHPGVLPSAKGMDVVAHSILDNLPLGVTVFKVDEGIDSGPILLTRYIDFNIKGLKLYEIEALIENISAKAMLEALEQIKKGPIDFVPQQGTGMLYKSLNYKEYRKVKSALKSRR